MEQIKILFFLRQYTSNAKLYLVSNLVGTLGAAIFFLLLNLYLARIGLGEEHISWVNSAWPLAEGLLAIPMSLIFERMPRRRALILFTTLQGVAGLLFLVFRTPWPLVGCSFLLGASFTIYAVLASPFLAENSTPAERLQLFSLNYLVIWVAQVIGDAIGGSLPSIFQGLLGFPLEVDGLRWGLGLGAVLLGLAALPLLFLRPYTHDRSEYGPARVAMRFPALAWRYLAAMLLVVLAAGLFVPFFNLFFDRQGFSALQIGLVFTFGSAVTVVGMALAPVLGRRFGKIGAICLTQLLSIPFLLILTFSGQAWLLIAAYTSRMALMNMGGPLGDTFAMEVVTAKQRASFSALLASVRALSWAATAPLAGILMAGLGFSWLFLAGAGLYLVSTILFWAFCRPNERKQLGTQ